MLNFLDNYEEMTASERKVLNYIVENMDVIPYMKINDLAETTYVSKTVIINLAQKLGYSGYKELKYYINQSVKDKVLHQKNSDLSYREILDQSINKTFSIVSEEMLQNCAKKIQASENVFIMARGTSKAVGYYLEHLLLSIGIQCIFIKDYNLSELFTNFVAKNDMVIFISMSGNTKKIIDTAKKVHFKEAKIISITSFQTNELTKYTNDNLYCYSDNNDTKKNDKISRIGFFLIVDLLINELTRLNDY